MRSAIELLVQAITAESELAEQSRVILHQRFRWTPLAEIFDEQRELVETARRRAFPATGAVTHAIKEIVAASQRRFVDGRIDHLFTEHGCEPHWWVPALQWHARQTERRVHGWFTAMEVYAPEREVMIVRGVVAAMLREGRVSDVDRVVLEGFLTQPQLIARPTVALVEELPTASCFISYSSRDEAIAQRLHADLQAHNVRCWFAPHDMRIGDSLIDRIDQAIRSHEKLLLILSESSVASAWVEAEVKTALMRERSEDRVVLFPVRIDDAVLHATNGWAAQLQERHLGDFRSWKDYDAYWVAFQHLLCDLRAG